MNSQKHMARGEVFDMYSMDLPSGTHLLFIHLLPPHTQINSNGG